MRLQWLTSVQRCRPSWLLLTLRLDRCLSGHGFPGLQVNLDFKDEADMVQMARVGIALQPIATALFANSPFIEGKPSGFLSWRSHVWTDTVGFERSYLYFDGAVCRSALHAEASQQTDAPAQVNNGTVCTNLIICGRNDRALHRHTVCGRDCFPRATENRCPSRTASAAVHWFCCRTQTDAAFCPSCLMTTLASSATRSTRLTFPCTS